METQKDLKFAKQIWKSVFKTCNKKMVRCWQWINWSFKKKSIQSDLCDYCDAYILVIKNINAKGLFKNRAAFRKCKTEKNDTLVDEAEFIDIAMPMYNLIEYSDNYFDTSGNLWQFKRDEIEENVDVTVDDQHIPNNSSSFKYN